MTDEEINTLATKLAETLATKEDISRLEGKVNNLEGKVDNLEGKVDELDNKADTILKFVEGVDEISVDQEKRLKRIEAIPTIAHQIKE